MEDYIDIHSHVLPGIDDGANNWEISMEMLEIAQKNRIRDMILTPHHKPARHSAGPGKVKALAEQLQELAGQEGISIRLHVGNEIYYSSGAVKELEEGNVCTMAGSRYVLVEFGPADEPDYIRKGVYQLLSAGYCPILAHAERYENICARMGRVEDLVSMGCYIQVNAGSIMGQFGYGAKQTARKLLKKDLVHFVATDAHNTGKRAPVLFECARYLEKKYGEEYKDRLLRGNPLHVIANRYI